MGFEDFKEQSNITKNQKPEKKDKISPAPEKKRRINYYTDSADSKGENNEPENKGRRGFLKTLAYGAGAFATGAIVKELLNDEDEVKKEKFREPSKIQKEDDNLTEEKKLKIKNEVEIKNIADIFLKTYYELSSSEHWPPADVVTTDLYIGQQLQESGLKRKAESGAGARGIMQNMEISIVDTVRYLNKLSRNTDFNYNGPKELNKQQIKDIMNLLFENADYSRAFGKLYLCALWDQKWGYQVGKTYYDKGNIKEAQQELLGSYNGGYKRIRREPINKWPSESRQYAKKILNYTERLKNIRDKFNLAKLSLAKEDYAAALMAREMDRPKNIKDKYKLLDKYTEIIKEKREELKRDLNEEEIRIIFEDK